MSGGPLSFDADAQGNLYFADYEGSRVSVVDRGGAEKQVYALPFFPGRIRVLSRNDILVKDAENESTYAITSNGALAPFKGSAVDFSTSTSLQLILSIDGNNEFSACPQGDIPKTQCQYNFPSNGHSLINVVLLGVTGASNNLCFDIYVGTPGEPSTTKRYVGVYDRNRTLIAVAGPLEGNYDYLPTDDLRLVGSRLYQMRPADGKLYKVEWSLD
jgi:hypothetical protein